MMMVRQVIAGGIDTIKFIPAIRDIAATTAKPGAVLIPVCAQPTPFLSR
jgi:hypothetical protein